MIKLIQLSYYYTKIRFIRFILPVNPSGNALMNTTTSFDLHFRLGDDHDLDSMDIFHFDNKHLKPNLLSIYNAFDVTLLLFSILFVTERLCSVTINCTKCDYVTPNHNQE
eukprot:438001_1